MSGGFADVAPASWALRSARLGPVLAIGWLAVITATLVLLPREALELALIGVVGAVAWAELRRTQWTSFQLAVALLVLATPLLSTWPARKWQAGVSRLPAPLDGLCNLHSLLLIAAVVIGGKPLLRRARAARGWVAAGAILLVAGGFLAALVHADAAALADAWVALAVPAGVGALVAAAVESRHDAWRYLGLTTLAALVPVGVGLAAYVVDFGFPTTPSDLVFGKLALFRPHLFQDVTFGNVGHFGDIALTLIPVAVLGASALALRATLRIAAGVAAVGLVLILMLVLSRSALAAALVVLAAEVALLARPGYWRNALAPAVVFAAVLAIAATPSVSNSIGALLPLHSQGGSGTAAAISDPSEQMRVEAIKTGLRIAKHHLPFGVGSGAYPQYDPVYTAPHSLFVQILAEDGFLGALGFTLIVLAVLGALVRATFDRRHQRNGLLTVRTACLAGSAAFLADGVTTGAPLALGQLNVWPLLLATLLGAYGGLRSA